MFRRIAPVFCIFVAAAGCSESGVTPALTAPTTPTTPTTAPAANTARAARERLTRTLALALADPATRAAVKRRLDESNAPEGKLQFQALARTDGDALLVSLARAGAATTADLVADLDAARRLELYLPVPAQRAAWHGGEDFLVATIGQDGEAPVAFDARGVRQVLDPRTPPAAPVLALVPQETDFTAGHPENMMACVDLCDPPAGGGGTSSQPKPSAEPGIYLVQNHFNSTYESWLKGNPEFEYHVYGQGDDLESVQLSCTGEHAGGIYSWDQNTLDWTGSVMLISDADYNAYQRLHPGAPIRVVAWEDDDQACVDHADGTSVSQLVQSVDNAYRSITSGKSDPFYLHGLRAAPSVFSLLSTLRNVILTADDFIGNAVEGTVTRDAPGSSNWVVKSSGTTTVGWFTTMRKP
ncbi:MAG: hypothetical protein ACREL5_00385 [Gemmatimonadales bacterium]